MKKTVVFCFGLLMALAALRVDVSAAEQPSSYVVDYKYLYTYTQDSLARFWKKNNIPQAISKVSNDVDMYEVTYKGLWLDSTYIMAKGVLYVPKVDKPVAEMVYCHGTRISVAQSYGIQDLEQFITILHAADGYVAYFPFYYGLGGGEKEHVYQHAWTEAMSVIHMIKAGREILPKINVETSGQLFVTGYSQGGHAAMATHKYIEEYFPEIDITASSPMSGAYDMTGVQSKSMFQHYDRPHYLPYLLISYDYAYDMWDGDVYSVFKPPFDTQLKEYFVQPRKVDYGYLDEVLPKVPKEMVIDSLVEVFRNDEDFIFTQLLRENNLYDWKPEAPMQLCACKGDNEVMYQNTEVAYEHIKNNGGDVNMRMFGKHLSHNPCAPFAIMYSKIYFDNHRAGKKKVTKIPFKKRFLINMGIMIANRQGKKTLKKTGKVEEDAMSVRKK